MGMSIKKSSSIKEFRVRNALGTLEGMPEEQHNQILMNLNFLGRIKLAIWVLYVYHKRYFKIDVLKIMIPKLIKYILYCDLGDDDD